MENSKWHAWRKGGIGSSDAASVHNESPYSTAHELYLEKTCAEQYKESNYAFEKGHDLEPKARALFEADWKLKQKTETKFQPRNFEHDSLFFIRASLDGISPDGGTFIEIKHVGKEVYESGIIPRHYWIQMQHQFLASNATRAFYVPVREVVDVSTDPPTKRIEISPIEVQKDDEFLSVHIEKCTEFWNYVQTKTPPALSDKDFAELQGHDLLISTYVALKKQYDHIEKCMDEAKEKIISKLTHPRMKCGSFRIQKITSKGLISYKDFIKSPVILNAMKNNNIDLESFRAPEKESYKISIKKV